MPPNLTIPIPTRPLVLGRASSFLLVLPPGPSSLAGTPHRDANEHCCSAVPLRVAVVLRHRRLRDPCPLSPGLPSPSMVPTALPPDRGPPCHHGRGFSVPPPPPSPEAALGPRLIRPPPVPRCWRCWGSSSPSPWGLAHAAS
jgi:hypothetical protein